MVNICQETYEANGEEEEEGGGGSKPTSSGGCASIDSLSFFCLVWKLNTYTFVGIFFVCEHAHVHMCECCSLQSRYTCEDHLLVVKLDLKYSQEFLNYILFVYFFMFMYEFYVVICKCGNLQDLNVVSWLFAKKTSKSVNVPFRLHHSMHLVIL